MISWDCNICNLTYSYLSGRYDDEWNDEDIDGYLSCKRKYIIKDSRCAQTRLYNSALSNLFYFICF